MLHKFVVNLCVTPHVHASWRGVCWDKAFLPHPAFHSSALLALFFACLSLAPPAWHVVVYDLRTTHLVTFARRSSQVRSIHFSALRSSERTVDCS